MTSLKFATKQEQTLHYTSNETNLFSTLDAQSSNKANSGRFYAPPGIMRKRCSVTLYSHGPQCRDRQADRF